jgi:nanoRNase/pAp phosphatase (c-di-AMP/oligoRNAs hydrolase)
MHTIQDYVSQSDSVVVITHRRADLDAVGAAVGIAATHDGAVDIATPGGTKPEARSLLDGQSVMTEPELGSYDLQIVVDAPSSDRTAPIDPVSADTPLVVIDHHEPADLETQAAAVCLDTDAPATSLLVADVLESCGWDLPPTAAQALAAGILDDTDFRAVVRPAIADQTIGLLERARQADGSLAALWETAPAWSERMATATALVRASGYKAGHTILLVTRVGSEEAAAAHTLLGGNADIGVVISERSTGARVVARTADTMASDISLPADLLCPLADEFDGDGGGHARAGTATLRQGEPETIEDRVVEQIEASLGMQFGPIS